MLHNVVTYVQECLSVDAIVLKYSEFHQEWQEVAGGAFTLTPWYGEATAGVTAQSHFWDYWQRQDLNPGPCSPNPMLYQLSYPGVPGKQYLCKLVS